jgi:hypothetical protein
LPYRAGKGVFRTRDEQGQHYWAASFTHSPTQAHFRPFRDSVYGAAQAKRLATAYRRAWEKAFDAGELERFFAEDYPAQAQWPRRYFLSGTGKAHLQRDPLTAWCGRDLREWEEIGQPAEVCRNCRMRLDGYLSLGNLLLYYETVTPEELEGWAD